MADLRKGTDGPKPSSETGYDQSLLPDFHHDFLSEEHLQAFASALSAPEPSPSTDDLSLHISSPRLRTPEPSISSRTSFDSGAVRPKHVSVNSQSSLFITAQNDWAPVAPTKLGGKNKRRGEKKKGRKKVPRRSKDETREGYLYTIFQWPLLAIVCAWVAGLGVTYLFTRLYIWTYEHFIAWRGKRERLRRQILQAENYADWVAAAKELDTFLGNDRWKEDDSYAYYDHNTVKRVLEQMRKCRRRVEDEEGRSRVANGVGSSKPIEDLKALVDACVKSNFVGVENSRLYSQTYYGTKYLIQHFVDEGRLFRGIEMSSID